VQPVASRWRSTHGLETGLTVLFVVAAAVALVRAVALATRLVALDDPDATDFLSRARDADSFVSIMTIAWGVAVLAIIPCFIVWNYRAAKNQEALARQPERLGAGWAIGGWFIPLGNLVLPVLEIQDLWRGSDASIERGDPRWRIADRSWLIGWWWGLLIAGLVTFSGSPADQDELELAAVRGANLVAMVGMLCAAASAVLAILVVRRIDARQLETRDAHARAST
jgi:hypothetical protein